MSGEDIEMVSRIDQFTLLRLITPHAIALKASDDAERIQSHKACEPFGAAGNRSKLRRFEMERSAEILRILR